LNREIGFNRQKAGEGIALVIRELPAKTVGAQEGLTLRLRHLTKIPEGTCYQTPPIDRKCAKLLQGASDLPTLRRI
jgi:hypothetical protein